MSRRIDVPFASVLALLTALVCIAFAKSLVPNAAAGSTPPDKRHLH